MMSMLTLTTISTSYTPKPTSRICPGASTADCIDTWRASTPASIMNSSASMPASIVETATIIGAIDLWRDDPG